MAITPPTPAPAPTPTSPFAATLTASPDALFPHLTPAQIAQLAKLGVEREVKAGEIAQEAGDPHPRVFVVLEGRLEVVRPCADGEPPFAVFEPGMFTGELTLLSGRRGLIAVRAAADSRLIALDREQIMPLVQTDAELSEILMRAFILRRLAMIANSGSRRRSHRVRPLRRHAARQGVPDAQRPSVRVHRPRSRRDRARLHGPLPVHGRRRPRAHLPRRARAA